MHAPPAHTSTSATTLDVQGPTPAKTTTGSPVKRIDLKFLRALEVPPEAIPKYLSLLKPPTPINIPTLQHYLQDHPNQSAVTWLLSGFSQGFKIGYTGPRAPKEFPNLPCARANPMIIDKNMLKEVSLGHTAGPFLSPPLPNLQVYPIEAIPKKHSSEWRTIFHLSYPKRHSTSGMLIYPQRPTHSNTSKWTMQLPYSRTLVKIASCLNWTSKLPSVKSQSTHLTGNSSG